MYSVYQYHYINLFWLLIEDIYNSFCQNETLIAIKAPHGTTLEVPDPDEVNFVGYQIYVDLMNLTYIFLNETLPCSIRLLIILKGDTE